MKQNYILLLIAPFFLFSCDNDDTLTIETNLPVTVSVEVGGQSVKDQKSGKTEYPFTASETYYLSDNVDLKNYMNNITYIFSKGFSAQTTSLAIGDTINNVTISIGESIVNISQRESASPLVQKGFIYASFGKVLMEEKQVTVTVEGTANKPSMNFDVSMELLIEATANK